MEAREYRSFECEWPEIARWLKGALARRGVPFNTLDDVVQETGCRLFGMWERVDMSRSTRALALAIATNFVWDERNRRFHPEPVEELPETASTNDVEAAGIARFELARVKRALGDLNPSHQQALLAEIGNAEPPAISQAALKMLRHRARRRLHLILDSASAGCLIFSVKLRDLSFRLQQATRRYATAIETPSGTVAAACAAAVTLSTTAMASPPAESTDAFRSTPAPAVAELRDQRVDRDGWVHTPGRKNTSAPRQSTAATTAPSEEPTTGLEVRSEGDTGPNAGVFWKPKNEGDDTLDPPACTVDSPDEDAVAVSCRVDTGDEEHTIGARIELQP